MKTLSLIISAVFCALTIWSQNTIPLIGDKAPSFEANTTTGKLIFPDDFGNNWKILFSHPRDFTPVCSSEIFQLAQMQEDFAALGVKVAIISTDDITTHQRWKKSIEDIDQDGIKPVTIDFPLIDDFNSNISRMYGMIHKENGNVKDVRGVFIIDPNNTIEAIVFYPMKVGRNMEEIKRAIIALQTVNTHESTPVNWKPGDDMLMAASPHLNPSLTDSTEIRRLYYNVGPIMWYKRGEYSTNPFVIKE